MKAETRFRTKVRALLKTVPKSHWFSIQQMAICGSPDIMGVVNGLFVALELKSGEKSPVSVLQKFNIDQINKCGGYGKILYPENLDLVMKFLIKHSQE